MRQKICYAIGCIVLFFGTLSAQDGSNLYTFLCASCHEGGNDRAPSRAALRAMPPERVLAAMESGAMVSMASGRSTGERRAIAEFVSGKPLGNALSTIPPADARCSFAGAFSDPLTGPAWNGWGVNVSNTRFQEASGAGFTASEVPRLKLKWAFGFPGDIAADAQPTVAGGRVFVGSGSGVVYALNAATGCVHWFFQAAAPVRA